MQRSANCAQHHIYLHFDLILILFSLSLLVFLFLFICLCHYLNQLPPSTCVVFTFHSFFFPYLSLFSCCHWGGAPLSKKFSRPPYPLISHQLLSNIPCTHTHASASIYLCSPPTHQYPPSTPPSVRGTNAFVQYLQQTDQWAVISDRKKVIMVFTTSSPCHRLKWARSPNILKHTHLNSRSLTHTHTVLCTCT